MRHSGSRIRRLAAAVALGALAAAPGSLPAADYFSGKKVYSRHCVGCHGVDGAGEAAGAPNFRYGTRLLQPDGALFQTIVQGRGGMPAFRGILSEEEILDVISYMRTLRR